MDTVASKIVIEIIRYRITSTAYDAVKIANTVGATPLQVDAVRDWMAKSETITFSSIAGTERIPAFNFLSCS